MHVTLILRKQDNPNLVIYNKIILQHQCVKYLGLHFVRGVTWKNHIKAKEIPLSYI